MQQSGEYLWEYQLDSDTIQVELIKQEWYFTIRETKKTIVRTSLGNKRTLKESTENRDQDPWAFPADFCR